MKNTILMVDDDPLVHRVMGRTLTEQGFTVVSATSGEEALKTMRQSLPDLVLLDLALGGLDGMDVLNAIKSDKKLSAIPIIVLTGSDEGAKDVACLDGGADDYVVKTFEGDKFMARVRAVLRRANLKGERAGILHFGAMSIDTGRRAVLYKGRVIESFTQKEFDLLLCLAVGSPNVLTRDYLSKKIWGDRQGVDTTRTIDVHIRRIRQKLGEILSDAIVTSPGQGYKFISPLSE